MNIAIGLLLAGVLALQSLQAWARDTMPERQLDTFIRLSGLRPNAGNGQEFFIRTHGREWSCASCHGPDPSAAGKHAKSGQLIHALAPKANPDRLTDAANTEMWFRRDCRVVLGRECTPEEKADVLAWLLSLPK